MNQGRHNCIPMNHKGQLVQGKRHIGWSGGLAPPGYYRALDDDGEYHFYAVEDENWERQRQINEQFGLTLQALALCMSAFSKIGISLPTITSQCLSNTGENKDSGIKEKTICNAKTLHTTKEKRCKVREWQHVSSEEKIAKSTIEQISLEMATESGISTGKSLLIHVDLVDSGISSEVGSDVGGNNSEDEIPAIIKLTSPNSMIGERERNHLSPEANNHLRPEVRKTYGDDLQAANISDVSNGSGTRELGELYRTEPLAFGTRMLIEPDSLGKTITSTVQNLEAQTVSLSPCDSGVDSETEDDANTWPRTMPVGDVEKKLKPETTTAEEALKKKGEKHKKKLEGSWLLLTFSRDGTNRGIGTLHTSVAMGVSWGSDEKVFGPS